MQPSKLQETQQIKAMNWQKNLTVLRASEFTFSVRSDSKTVLFSGNGKRPVSFFPSTEKWVYKNNPIKGTAEEFLVWYRELEE